MNIAGKIAGIKYKIFLEEKLKSVDIRDFNINESPAYCLVKNGDNAFAASKWVSPKRTCSYPYEKVYNTLNFSKKITVIPIVKDEGFDGDRDFLQWDTVYLIESKHSKNGILPSVGDIKDGLLFKEAVENGIEVTMG